MFRSYIHPTHPATIKLPSPSPQFPIPPRPQSTGVAAEAVLRQRNDKRRLTRLTTDNRQPAPQNASTDMNKGRRSKEMRQGGLRRAVSRSYGMFLLVSNVSFSTNLFKLEWTVMMTTNVCLNLNVSIDHHLTSSHQATTP